MSGLGGTVYYHWYVDGCFIAAGTSNSRTFFLARDDQVRIDIQDTNDADYDSIANAPTDDPARRSLWWCRSLATDIDHYRVEQKKGAGAWETIGIVHHVADRWSYELLSPRLDDLADYTWRMVPVDAAGNDGTTIEFGPERIVRRPDAPDFGVAFDDATTKVTFSDA